MADDVVNESGGEVSSHDARVDVGMSLYGEKVRQADVEEFFDEMFEKECSICHKGQYFPYLYAPTNKRFAAIVSIKILGEEASLERGRFEFDDERFIPIYTVHCENCGHVRQHTIFAVVQWLRNRGQG